MRITVAGLTQAQAKIQAMAARCRDMRPIMAEGAAAIVTLIDDSFRQQREPGGKPWTPLAPGTVEARLMRKKSMRSKRGTGLNKRGQAAVGSEKILIDTGRMRASSFATSGPRSIKFGTNTVYAATQQLGRGAIPPRPFLPVTQQGGRFVLTETGPAGVAFQRIRERLRAYVTGR